MEQSDVRKPESQEAYLKQSIKEYEEEMLQIQTQLAENRKQELLIRQSLQEIEQKKDPGVYLFKPICNWNLDEERKMKEKLKLLLDDTANKKNQLNKRKQQKEVLIQIGNKLKDDQQKKASASESAVKKIKQLEKETKEQYEDHKKQEMNLRYILTDIVAQLIYMKECENNMAESRKKEEEQQEQKTEQQINLFQFLESNMEEQIRRLLGSFVITEENKFYDNVEILIEMIQWKIRSRGLDPDQMFHVKHLVSQKEKTLEYKISSSASAVLYSIIDFCVAELMSHIEEQADIELSVSDTMLEFYMEYTITNENLKQQFDQNNAIRLKRLRSIYENRVIQNQGEVIAADHCLLIELPLFVSE